MKTLKAGLCALALLAAEAGFASAAWNNVFQATLVSRRQPVAAQTAQTASQPGASKMVVGQLVCASCGGLGSTSGYSYSSGYAGSSGNGCCPQQQCCPTQQCTTRYIQRTYYQPCTTYQSKSYYEQVTSYQTSYYYEPCTSYRYSCAYDPCTCSYQQVAVPQTSYTLRSQCCPVTSWVQRCGYEPVTTYRQACYYEPVTTCCSTTTGAPVTSIPQTASQAPVVTEQRSTMPPAVTEQRSTSPPVVDIPAPPADDMLDGMGMRNTRPYTNRAKFPNTSSKQPAPQNTWQPSKAAPAPRQITPPSPPVKLDRIVVGPNAQVEGQIVRSDNTPRPNALVTFVSADKSLATQKVTANYAGRFRVTLPSGGWLVYLDAANGTSVYHSRINVDGQRHVTLVSRTN